MSNIEKIDKAQFQVMLNSGHRYTGLLDKIGYVYWTREEIFFVKIYPVAYSKVDISPIPKLGITEKHYFQEISPLRVSYYKNGRFLVVTKPKFKLKVISVAELELYDKQLYKQYHGGRVPMKSDKIQPPTNRLPLTTGTAKIQKGIPDGVAAVANVGKDVDDHVGVYFDVLESLNIGGKTIPFVGNVLATFSIISDLSDGDYISATGELIVSLAGWYGVVWQIGKMIYDSDDFKIEDYNSKLRNYNYWRGKGRPGSRARRNEDAFLEALIDVYPRYERVMRNKK